MIVAGIAIVVLGVLLALQGLGIVKERREWATERRALVDRAIARHSGEVIGLDRQASNGEHRERVPRPPIEGLE